MIELTDAAGHGLLSDGDPRWWTGRSPLLFPIVGRVPEDRALIDGRAYELRQHGFARTSDFALVQADANSCTFRLAAGPATLARYPRAFLLEVRYVLDGARLGVGVRVSNHDARPMPYAFGFHPALRWPLLPGGVREEHRIVFAHAESAPVRRPLDGLLGEPQASPVSGRQLAVHDALFVDGALVFDTLASRSVRYEDGRGAALEIAFADLPHLGIWTQPGAPFLCIEPWHGYAAPLGFTGELATKPGTVLLAPGATREHRMDITAFTA